MRSLRSNVFCHDVSLVYVMFNSGVLTLGTNDPCDTPARKTEALGKTVNDEHIILIDILDVLGGGNGSTVAVASVVVAGVELVADKGGTATANVLDLSQLGVGNDTAGRVTGVGGEDDGSTTGDFLGDLVGVDVVSILFGQRDRNSSKLYNVISRRIPTEIMKCTLTFLNRLSISLYAV